MYKSYKVAVVVGSLRKASVNRKAAEAVQRLQDPFPPRDEPRRHGTRKDKMVIRDKTDCSFSIAKNA